MPVKLPRIQFGLRAVEGDRLTRALHTALNEVIKQAEDAINNQAELIESIAAAQAAADAANTAAETANSATEALSAADNLAKSGTRGLTMSAADAGANVTITISAHTRVYGDGSEVAVDGGSLTGLPHSETRYVYYDDPDRTGGAVTYLSSTDEAEAVQINDRHSLGVVETPAAAAPPNGGFYTRPPGVVDLR